VRREGAGGLPWPGVGRLPGRRAGPAGGRPAAGRGLGPPRRDAPDDTCPGYLPSEGINERLATGVVIPAPGGPPSSPLAEDGLDREAPAHKPADLAAPRSPVVPSSPPGAAREEGTMQLELEDVKARIERLDRFARGLAREVGLQRDDDGLLL